MVHFDVACYAMLKISFRNALIQLTRFLGIKLFHLTLGSPIRNNFDSDLDDRFIKNMFLLFFEDPE